MSDNAVPGWVLGVAASVVAAAIIGVASTLFAMTGKIAALEATQTALVITINRTLDELSRKRD